MWELIDSEGPCACAGSVIMTLARTSVHSHAFAIEDMEDYGCVYVLEVVRHCVA